MTVTKIAIGQDLIDVKARLAHGQFLPWLESEFGMSEDSAQRFMRVARRLGDKYRKLRYLGVSVLYELTSPSTPDTVMEMVETGQIPAALPAIREAKQIEKLAEHETILADFEEMQIPPLAESERYQLAIDTGTVDYYHDDLRREVSRQDTKSAALTALQSSDS